MPAASRRHGNGSLDVSSAGAIAQTLLDFLGDTTGLPEALAASIPPINDVRPVDLPSVADPLPHDYPDVREPAAPAVEEPEEPEQHPEEQPEEQPATVAVPTPSEPAQPDQPDQPDRPDDPDDEPPIPSVSDLPTEAGMPVFGADDEVDWLRARSTPPPPPPKLRKHFSPSAAPW